MSESEAIGNESRRDQTVQERRTLLRILFALNGVLFAAWLGYVFFAAQTGEDPWIGMAVLWLLPLAIFVFIVLMPLAAIGFAAPIAIVDLGAAWFASAIRSPFHLGLAAGFALAFAVGTTLQYMATREWSRRRHSDP